MVAQRSTGPEVAEIPGMMSFMRFSLLLVTVLVILIKESTANQGADIQVFNRVTQAIEIEKIYGERAIRWLYEKSLFGMRGADLLSHMAFINELCGRFYDSARSAKKIDPFVETFNIPMDQFVSGPFRSFNEFFARQFLPGKRKFVQDPNILAAFAEGRYLGTKAVRDDSIRVKGINFNIDRLLGNSIYSSLFRDGPLLVARLTPVDYHRYHYPTDGKVIATYHVPGTWNSVNAIALERNPNILIENDRQVTILETSFGRLAYIEVGAICVGKIINSSAVGFKRGDEKGYFQFGGSTVVVVGEPGRWEPSPDILQNSAQNIETLVQLGTEVGEAK